MKPTTPGARIEAVLRGYQPDGRGGSRKLVLLGIAMHDGEGGSWPSTITLAEYASIDERNVRKALRALEDEGVISTHPNEGGTRNTRADRRSNLYVIDYERLLDDLTSASSREIDGGTPVSERGDASVRDGGTPASAEQDRERDEERDNHARVDRSLFDTGDVEIPDRFPEFWERYPRRDGKRVGRREAERVWERMSESDRTAALVGVEHYAASGWRPKDAHRWLRDRLWEDWQTPARPTTNTAPVRREKIDTNRDAPEGRIDL